MPRLDDIADKTHEVLELPGLPWLTEAVRPGFIRGCIYLLAGEPGIGKTTLSLQIIGEIVNSGRKVLYITTEQGLSDVRRTITRVLAEGGQPSTAIRKNLYVDDSVDDLDLLPRFLARRVLTDGEDYHGCAVIVLDSIQGRGVAAAATKKYNALYEFCNSAKAQGVVTLLIGHVTKKGQIAGPKDLEHNVDCIIYLRRAFQLRPLFVPKNRFGPAVLDPVVLVMDKHGRLTKSPHVAAQSTAIAGYAGIGEDIAEAQASVSLPKYGSRPELNAPFLPIKKVKQLLNVLSTLKDVDLADLSYAINCFIPRQQAYRAELDLPLVVALLSSYLQQPVDKSSLFVGEVDLMKRVRRPEQTYLAALAKLLVGPQRGKIEHVYLSEEAAVDFGEMQPEEGQPTLGQVVKIHSVTDLESVLRQLWPTLMLGKE